MSQRGLDEALQPTHIVVHDTDKPAATHNSVKFVRLPISGGISARRLLSSFLRDHVSSEVVVEASSNALSSIPHSICIFEHWPICEGIVVRQFNPRSLMRPQRHPSMPHAMSQWTAADDENHSQHIQVRELSDLCRNSSDTVHTQISIWPLTIRPPQRPISTIDPYNVVMLRNAPTEEGTAPFR